MGEPRVKLPSYPRLLINLETGIVCDTAGHRVGLLGRCEHVRDFGSDGNGHILDEVKFNILFHRPRKL